MEEDDYIYVEVTKIFKMTPQQGRRLVTIARALNADLVFHSTDADKTHLTWTGDDYLTGNGDVDYAAAACDVLDPEGMLQIELVVMTSRQLSP